MVYDKKVDSLVPATAQTPKLPAQPAPRAPPAGQVCQPETPKRVTRSATRAAQNTTKGKTGTVWDSVKMTDPVYKGTKIPKSFEIAVDNQRFWVHPNATKHMKEYLTEAIATTHSMPINSQMTSFKAAMEEAIAKGFKYDKIFTIGCWEFKIGAAKKQGLLPSIYHAMFNPKGFR